jgi:hypothetical protein
LRKVQQLRLTFCHAAHACLLFHMRWNTIAASSNVVGIFFLATGCFWAAALGATLGVGFGAGFGFGFGAAFGAAFTAAFTAGSGLGAAATGFNAALGSGVGRNCR